MSKEQRDAIYWHLNKLESYIKTYESITHAYNAMHSLGFIQGTIDILTKVDEPKDQRVCEHSGSVLDK